MDTVGTNFCPCNLHSGKVLALLAGLQGLRRAAGYELPDTPILSLRPQGRPHHVCREHFHKCASASSPRFLGSPSQLHCYRFPLSSVLAYPRSSLMEHLPQQAHAQTFVLGPLLWAPRELILRVPCISYRGLTWEGKRPGVHWPAERPEPQLPSVLALASCS